VEGTESSNGITEAGLEELGLDQIALGLAVCGICFLVSRTILRRIPSHRWGGSRWGLVLFAAVYLTLIVLRPLLSPFLDEGEGDDRTVSPGLFLMALFQGAVCFVALGVVLVRRKTEGLREIGFRLNKFWIVLAFAFFAYFAFYPLYAFCCYLNSLVISYEPQRIVQEMLEDPELLTALPVVLSACIFIPVLEEIMFRGFLQSGLRDFLPPLAAVIISAVFFGCMHEVQAIIPVFALGCFLGYLRERTGSIWACMWVHVIHNSLMLAVLPSTY
jgi:membrane protease YdiL (CAAX protease family)